MDKSIRQHGPGANTELPAIGLGRYRIKPLSDNERKVLMNWFKGDVSVAQIFAHRIHHGTPFGVLPGGAPARRAARVIQQGPADGPPEAA
jgi:hypothetical protein